MRCGQQVLLHGGGGGLVGEQDCRDCHTSRRGACRGYLHALVTCTWKNARHYQLCAYLSCALSSCSRWSSDAKGMCSGACWQYKFLRGGHLCGHVEDVVVDASQRYGCRLDVCECAGLIMFGPGVIGVLDTWETPSSPMHSILPPSCPGTRTPGVLDTLEA